MNITKYFQEHKEFQHCFSFTLPGESGPKCIPATDVLLQTPHTLALTSTYVDAIWKAVDFAKTLGYHVDGITSYITKSSDLPGSVNILVSMSR